MSNLINSATAAALANACRRVLEVKTTGRASAAKIVVKGDDARGDGGTEAGPDAPQQYRYPFRPGFLAKLVIPNATSAEVNRLVARAKTLAVDYQPEQ